MLGSFVLLSPAFGLLAQDGGGAGASTSPPVAYASVSELNGLVGQLQKTADSMKADLDKARIEKWKTGANTKQEALANVQSIQRNLQTALPEIIAKLNASPEDLAVSFKLYRNLDALYDVFGSVVESAGAFGAKDEFQSLNEDMTSLEAARRAFGERTQKLAASKEDELARLRTQVKTLSAAPPPPPKKVVVDDTAPAKKPVKKKPAKAKAAPAAEGAQPPPS